MIIDIFSPVIHTKKRATNAFAVTYIAIAVLMLLSWGFGIYKHDQMLQTVTMFVLWMVCLISFFVLTGFEVAYTDLRDKDPHQVAKPLQDLLEKMQKEESKLYESKEWCSVIVTVAFALIAEWHFEAHAHLLPPAVEHVVAAMRPPLVLAFTTVPILWLAQGPAKRYATRNSESFLLRFGSSTWVVVGNIGRLIEACKLRSPSDAIVDFFGLGPKRNLRPSLPAHYMMSLKRFGHAYYSVDESVQIHADGSSTMNVRFVACAIDPIVERGFKNTLKVKAGGVKTCTATVVSAYQARLPGEQFRDLEAQMKSMGTDPDEPTNRIDSSNFLVTYNSENADEGETVYEFRIRPSFEPTSPEVAFFIQYSVCYELNPGIWTMPEEGKEPEDTHGRTFDWPTASYHVHICFDPGVKGTFANVTPDVLFGDTKHRVELGRATDALQHHGDVEMKLLFPLAGGRYKLHWNVWTQH